jgi:hypothetical protein
MKKFEDAERLMLIAPAAWVRMVDEWRRAQPGLPNRSLAIRQLVERGIKGSPRKKHARSP